MVPGRLKSVLTKSAETIAAIVLVLAFFAVILGMMETFFPIGSRFQDLMRGDESAQQGSASGKRDILVSSQGTESNLTDPSSAVATLSTIQQTVKSKQADSIAWRNAEAGMALQNRDAIQTQKGATAAIAFDKNNTLQLGENSLIVIRRMETGPLLGRRRAFSMAVDGELSGKLAAGSSDTIHLELTTPNTVARLKSPVQGGEETAFKITVNPDNTSTVAVFSGMAELLTATGQQIRVEANQAATVSATGVSTRTLIPPKAPAPAAPADGDKYYYRELPPRVTFSWAPQDQTRQFHFNLARDPAFSEPVVSTALTATAYSHGNLKPGKYYWRVSSFNQLMESRAGPTRSFELVRDTDPPSLTVEFPPPTATTARQMLRGGTEPGTKLIVAGVAVTPLADGSFQHEIELERGSNVLVVEAVDLAGNASFRSQLVQGRFP